MSFLRAGLKSSLRPRVLSSFSSPAVASSRVWRPLMLTQRANYSESAALSKDVIQTRVLDVLKSFEKVDVGKVQPSSYFAQDLGLDSLDAVEVVMAIEEEFSIEIPDAEADAITTVQQAIDYIHKTPEAR